MIANAKANMLDRKQIEKVKAQNLKTYNERLAKRKAIAKKHVKKEEDDE